MEAALRETFSDREFARDFCAWIPRFWPSLHAGTQVILTKRPEYGERAFTLMWALNGVARESGVFCSDDLLQESYADMDINIECVWTRNPRHPFAVVIW